MYAVCVPRRQKPTTHVGSTIPPPSLIPHPPSSPVPLPPSSPFLRLPQALRKLNVGFCPLVSEGGPSVPGEYLDSDEMTKEELEDEEHVTPMFPVPRRRRREKKVLSWVFVHC